MYCVEYLVGKKVKNSDENGDDQANKKTVSKVN